MPTNKFKTGPQFRGLEFLQGSIDKDARTVKVKFSSEYPVQRYINGVIGDEILDHSPQSVDLGRLNDGGPVLMDHNSADPVGVVENASIDSDRVGRALLRFGNSQRATEVFNDIVDGVRRTISVGYHVKKYLAEKSGKSMIFRAVDWTPFEITLTAVPADPTAQIGRGLDLNTTTEVIMPDEKKPETATDEKSGFVDMQGEIEKAKRAETTRQKNIRAAGMRYDCEDLIERAIAEDWTADQMNKSVLEKIGERVSKVEPVSKIGLSRGEVNKYSLLRAINAAYTNDWSKAGFEREASQAIEDEIGRPAQGFYIPYEIQTSRSYKGERVMTVGTAADGGYLKGTDHLAGSFIDLLRANALMGGLNARFLPGLVGDVDIPRLDGGVAFNWVTEDADATPDDATLGTVAMAPKTIVGEVPISRRLLKQSTPSVEQMLLDDMAMGAALAIDLAAFQGSGASGQPTGITQTAGVATSTIATPGAPTFVELVEFETDVLTANALGGTLAYCTTAPVQGSMKTTTLDSGSGLFLMMNGEANGYPVRISTQLTANSIIFGNFEDVIIGLWGVLDVEPDKAEKAASGGLVLRVFQDCDVGIRHAGSFSINA